MVAPICEIDKDWLFVAGATNGMHESETLFQEIVSLNAGQLEGIFFCELLGLKFEELRVGLVCSHVGPLPCFNI